jgi:hypothetical protein
VGQFDKVHFVIPNRAESPVRNLLFPRAMPMGSGDFADLKLRGTGFIDQLDRVPQICGS